MKGKPLNEIFNILFYALAVLALFLVFWNGTVSLILGCIALVFLDAAVILEKREARKNQPVKKKKQ